MKLIKTFKDSYSYFYFLASLGSGGLAVSFFMYLMFMVPHKGSAMVTWAHIYPYLEKMNFVSFLIIIAMIGILYFAYWHFKLLFWNVYQHINFKKTSAYEKLRSSNAEVTLMTMPLTYAMTINVFFILGAVFVPGLMNYADYLMPFALLGFIIIGIYALKIFGSYFVRLMIEGSYDFDKNNNLSQMISIFAFGMIAVGFAAPGAMSSNLQISAIGLFLSIFFLVVAATLALIKITFGMYSILHHGISKETSVSLWIMVPILTLMDITLMRATFGFYHGFLHNQPTNAWLFVLSSAILSLQLMFAYIGYATMKKVNYFKDYIFGELKSPASYAIICPFVAFFVSGMFFIFYGVLNSKIIEIFSLPYFILLIPFSCSQILGIIVILKLNKKLLSR